MTENVEEGLKADEKTFPLQPLPELKNEHLAILKKKKGFQCAK